MRAAVEGLGGELDLSTAGESGAMFRCWLPLSQADTDPLDREATVKLEVPVTAEPPRARCPRPDDHPA